MTITKADLLEAAWARFEAAKAVQRARAELVRTGDLAQRGREQYRQAAQRSEFAIRRFEEIEMRLLMQDAPAAPVRQAVAS